MFFQLLKVKGTWFEIARRARASVFYCAITGLTGHVIA